MTTTLTRTDTGEIAPVRDYDPLGIGHVEIDHDLPLPWADAIETRMQAERGMSLLGILTDTRAMLAAAEAAIQHLHVQSPPLKLPERVGGFVPQVPAESDRQAALDATKRRATPMALRPDPIAQLAPAALDQPGDPDSMTAYMHADTSDNLLGSVVANFPPDEAGKNREGATPSTPEASGRGTGAGPSSPVEWPERQPTPPGPTPARTSRWDRWMGWLSDSGFRIENRLRAVGEPKGGA